MRPLLLCAPLLIGCAKAREHAPDDMDGLMSFLFASWEDPELLAEGVENLAPWLEGEGSTPRAREGYALTLLTEDDVAGVPHPDAPLEENLGVAAASLSAHPLASHAAVLALEDQLWNDPKTYDTYTREVVEGDPDLFTRQQASQLRTDNQIDKKGGFGVHIPYFMEKDFAWVELDSGARAIVGRSWVPERSCAENGNNCINQSFSIDLFYELDDEQIVRITTTWADLTTVVDSLLTDEALVKMMVEGMVGIFDNTDAFLDER